MSEKSKDRRMIEGQLNLFDMFAPEEKQTDGEPKQNTQSAAGFPECINCWCRDCRHNAGNEAVPRELCGTKMPCPACDSCVSEGEADICVIGSAKEGCRVRAGEEGIEE